MAAFPGGVGTQDELFEALTLMQTGRSNIVPLVLLEGEDKSYWTAWEKYVHDNLLSKGFISSEDKYLYYRAPSVEAAVDHIEQFYRRYHSSRYVKDLFVIRMLTPLSTDQIEALTEEFKPLIQEGKIFSTPSLAEETDHLELPRIAFFHNHRSFSLLRQLIDRLNEY